MTPDQKHLMRKFVRSDISKRRWPMFWNPSCPTCRNISPVLIEQTRPGGEWRIRVEGRTLAHAVRKQDAERLARLVRKGMRDE